MAANDSNRSLPQCHVRVGVGVLVKDPRNPLNVFCGIRKGSHGAGSLALPGGHLEMMESWEECAKREVKEEMGIDIVHVRFALITNDIMVEEQKHYVTIFMTGEFANPHDTLVNMEPDKCEGWESFSWDQLVETRAKGTPRLFGPLGALVDGKTEAVVDFFRQTV